MKAGRGEPTSYTTPCGRRLQGREGTPFLEGRFDDDASRWTGCRDGGESVNHFRRNRKTERHGLALAAELQRIQELAELGTLTDLQPGERHEALQHFAKSLGRRLVARFGANHAAHAAVDIAARREP